MRTREDWLAANDDFLSARLVWLRERLRALSGAADSGAAAPRQPAPDSELPLARLAAAFGLSGFETDTVFLCAAMELDTGLAGQCAAAQHDPGKPYPTFALALRLFDEPAWEALAPNGPLRHWPLVNVDPEGPLTVARLGADERLVNFIKGLNHLDERLSRFMAPIPAPAELPPSHMAAAQQIVTLVQGARPVPSFMLPGPHHLSKELVAAAVAESFGLRLVKLGSIPETVGQAAALARLWQREVMLSDVALFIDAANATAAEQHSVRAWLAETDGLSFVAVADPWPRMATHCLDIAKPTPPEQAAAWQGVLDEPAATTMASHFDLDLPAIATILGRAGKAPEPFAAAWSAALESVRPALDRLAQRITPKATLENIKLPAAESAMLREIVGQVRRRGTVYRSYGFGERLTRGTGISVLFAGESGTGKTMAAEAVATELGLLLYKIDLSAVVNKYIGETEKNLRAIFDAAEAGGAVLFFDEADALFGKRSEVRDSHDRYANIEVSYLLQRMESFNGLAVLATNRKDSLDPAFLRRLRFVLTFPFPAQTERREIWREAFPPQAPVGEVDFDRLARLNLTGGSIHNVALNAAFLAANCGGLVTMEMMLAAARSEFRKLERPINESDFTAPIGGGRS